MVHRTGMGRTDDELRRSDWLRWPCIPGKVDRPVQSCLSDPDYSWPETDSRETVLRLPSFVLRLMMIRLAPTATSQFNTDTLPIAVVGEFNCVDREYVSASNT